MKHGGRRREHITKINNILCSQCVLCETLREVISCANVKLNQTENKTNRGYEDVWFFHQMQTKC